mmetsp:Transcript_13921/g.20552  ORF Transcript_13921/g.20552 Transcript_13921/m.20552 type:complete len:759 (+) Transcript_13921:110-2386(+)
MATQQDEQEKHSDVGNAFVLIVTVLFVFPAAFAYYILGNALLEQNLCHVGPASFHLANSILDGRLSTFHEQRASLVNLYGTYTSFDDSSYYFVKTPYKIRPKVLPDYGYWSISTLALTLLSPSLRQERQMEWKNQKEDWYYDIVTAPSIQWDQSHEIDIEELQKTNQHSSKSNRWCLVNIQDPRKYYKNPGLPASLKNTDQSAFWNGKESSQNAVSKVKSNITKTEDEKDQDQDVFKICGKPQTSIVSSGDEAPFFVELPLHPPGQAIWTKLETESPNMDSSSRDDDFVGSDEDNQFSSFRQYQDKYKFSLPNPYQVQVQCHVQNIDLHHLAQGLTQPDSAPRLQWEHTKTVKLPQMNPLALPGTSLIWIILLLVQLRRGPPNRLRRPPITSLGTVLEHEDWDLVRAMQLLWFQSTWLKWSVTALWLYFIGSFLEPVVGTIPYLAITSVFVQVIAISGENMTTNLFLLVCFGHSVVLSQLQSSLKVGTAEITVISFGDAKHALKLNVFCIVIALCTFVLYKKVPWRSGTCCLLFGWALSNSTVLELLGAPQWTIPTLLMAHLWWKLSKLPDDLTQINDDESISFCDGMKDEPPKVKKVCFGYQPDTMVSLKQRCCKSFNSCLGYLWFGVWMLLTLGCSFTLDWTLVVGNMMTLWLCIGTIQFPRHPLWSLYHMVASTVLIVINTMTLAGWCLCHVAIMTGALHALPPPYVYASMAVQIVAHTAALLRTAATKHWRLSQNTPGCYFWTHVKMLGSVIYS